MKNYKNYKKVGTIAAVVAAMLGADLELAFKEANAAMPVPMAHKVRKRKLLPTFVAHLPPPPGSEPVIDIQPCSNESFPLTLKEKSFDGDLKSYIQVIEHEIGPLRRSESFFLSRGYWALKHHQVLGWQQSKSKFFKAMFECEKFSERETNIPDSYVRWALDSRQIQIGRKIHGDVERFGVSLENGKPMIVVRQSSVDELPDLSVRAEVTAHHVNYLHSQGKFVLAVLGAARKITNTVLLKEITHVVIEAFQKVRGESLGAVMTGGYKGVRDGKWGVTRAGYDVAVERGLDPMVVMPKAGERDSHVNPITKNIVGIMWGDDSPSLVAASDVAVVFGPYGLWTEIEIMNLRAQKKPFIEIDLSQDAIDKLGPTGLKEHIFQQVMNLAKDKRLDSERLKAFGDSEPDYSPGPFIRQPSLQYDHGKQQWLTPNP